MVSSNVSGATVVKENRQPCDLYPDSPHTDTVPNGQAALLQNRLIILDHLTVLFEWVSAGICTRLWLAAVTAAAFGKPQQGTDLNTVASEGTDLFTKNLCQAL